MVEEKEAEESEWMKKSKAKREAEEEEGGDDFDPLAMMGGMAEEKEAEESEWMKKSKAKREAAEEEARTYVKSQSLRQELAKKAAQSMGLDVASLMVGPLPGSTSGGLRLARDRTLQGPGIDDQQSAGRELGQPFFFMQLADTQLGYAEDCRRTYGWAEEAALLHHAVVEINRFRPAFAIVCGDIVNTYPRAKKCKTPESQQEFGEKHDAQVQDFTAACSLVDPSIPLICVCGNHDVDDCPNAAKNEEYRTDFGHDYYSFWIGDVKFVVLNSQYFSRDGIERDAESYRSAHDQWLEDELAGEDTARARHVIAFCHIPPFLRSADEDDSYFTLPRHERDRLLKVLAEHRVTSLFCGHYHRRAGGNFVAPSGHCLDIVITAACGTNIDPSLHPESHTVMWPTGPEISGVRMVRVADRVTHQWYTFDELGGVSEAHLLCSECELNCEY